MLNLCREEKAIAQGEFFDLMYANLGGWRMNEHRQYAFLRKYEKELLLIVVNFDNTPANIGVNIPLHAFEYLHLPHLAHTQATDLLSGKAESVNLLPDKPVEVAVEGYGGKILKLTF